MPPPFAQVNPPPAGGPAGPVGPGGFDWFDIFFFGALGLFVVVWYGLTIYYCLGVVNVLKAVHPTNRRMEPGLVWLNLVPCVQYIWPLLTAVWVDESLRNEYRDRGARHDPDTGKGLGIAAGICIFLGVPVGPFLLLFHLGKLRECVRELGEYYSEDGHADDRDDEYRRRYNRRDDEGDRGYRRRYE